MKTAISIPDDVFAAADAAAKRAGMSRSQLYVAAIRLFLSTHGDKRVTDKLNELYATQESRLDPVLSRMQSVSFDPGDEW